MTVIFESAEFHIESIIIPRQVVPGNSQVNVDTTLERPGRFLGASLAIDSNIVETIGEQFSVFISDTSDNEINYGDAISVIRVVLGKTGAAGVTVGIKLIVYIRK